MDASPEATLLRLQQQMSLAQDAFLWALQRRDSAAMDDGAELCALVFKQIKATQRLAAAESVKDETAARAL